MADFDDIDLSAKIPLSGGAQIAHLLGRIEATLIEMRRDIQAGTRAQADFTARLESMDRRVVDLESKEGSRKRFSRIVAGAALGLLIPALSAVQEAHDWFNTVNAVIFPRK